MLRNLLDEAGYLFEAKSKNYGSPEDPLANLRRSIDLGVPPFLSVLLRMQDKWSRIVNLAKGVPDKVGESLRDSLMDLAVYALIAIYLMDEGGGS